MGTREVIGKEVHQESLEYLLLLRVAKRDREALAEIYARFQRSLFRYLFHLLGQKELAEDVLQKVLVIIWQKAHTFQRKSEAAHWIFGIGFTTQWMGGLGFMTQQHEQHFSRSACPSEQLEWFANHTLMTEERVAVEAHLIQRAACRADVAAWSALRQSLQIISMRTPEPRADLFALVEQRLDKSAISPASWLRECLQSCWLFVMAGGALFCAQALLIRRDLFWLPLLIIPLAASVVYLPTIWQRMPASVGLLATLLTALGMAFLYGQQVDPAREITLIAPTSPRLVLGIRCCLVFGYDLLINCCLVLPLLALHGIITPAWFLTNWLAPLYCLSAIALLLSILVNASVAVVVCVLLWALRALNIVQLLLFGGRPPLPSAPWQQAYESFWHQGPLLFTLALLAVVLAFAFLEKKEHFTRC
jgi:hypothetical protein